MIPLKEHYKTSVVPELMKELELDSNMAVPFITKVTLNMGVGEVLQDKKLLEKAAEDMALISGQKPLMTKARKSVANFKIRDGMPIGCKVTLRGDRMYDFLQRLIGVAIPRERDFRGLDVRSFDGRGNYSIGIKEHIIFPEIDYDKVDMIRGMDIAISTSAVNDKEGEILLKAMKFPFKN
jgi:large subunit ribosomal protein L5